MGLEMTMGQIPKSNTSNKALQAIGDKSPQPER